ncbi:MAG: hypothetical protein ACFE8B_13695 [Candidatus Hermodarchaeota archaeon]
MKRKLRETKVLFAVLFLISIIGIVTTVNACGSNRVFFMAKGDDLDINANNFIIGKIKSSGSAQVLFHSKIYDESGEKVYVMKGMFKGSLLRTDYYFYCPVFNVWFINVWQVIGEGKYKTTDTDLDLIYRNWFPITMPNTEGKYVSETMVMLLSPTGEYYEPDPTDPLNPAKIPWGQPTETLEKGWVLAAVLCGIMIGPDMELPIGPISSLTIYIER